MSTIIAAIKLVILYLTRLLERDKDKRERQKDAIEVVKEGIQDRDPSKVTQGFDLLNQ